MPDQRQPRERAGGRGAAAATAVPGLSPFFSSALFVAENGVEVHSSTADRGCVGGASCALGSCHSPSVRRWIRSARPAVPILGSRDPQQRARRSIVLDGGQRRGRLLNAGVHERG